MMAEDYTPRQIVKDLLQGTAPRRPLYLPIVFSLGARIENLPLRSFLTNPTKITNSLRQIRGRVKSDGITCYYDPFLEAQALGGAVEWESGDHPRGVLWPGPAVNGEVPVGLRSPEDSAKSSSIITATEVIRRLKSLMRDDSLLTACLIGPFTLGALLSNADADGELRADDVQSFAVAFSVAVIARIASAFAEAGANVIFIREDVLPAPSTEVYSDWNSSLASTVNIIRFYEALPILLVTDPGADEANRSEVFSQIRDCIVCPVANSAESARTGDSAAERSPLGGVALPLELFNSQESPAEAADEALRRMISNGNPAVITTAGDVAATVDVKRLNKIWELLHCS
jgi:uroporphyrinogen-III decarboxylase